MFEVLGIIRVVYTDYLHMMLYECGLMKSDGSCADGQASVEILNRVAEPLESTLQNALTKRISELCMNITDIEPVPHNGKEQFSLSSCWKQMNKTSIPL